MQPQKRWQIMPAAMDKAQELARECAVPVLTAYLCVARGIVTAQELQSFVCANPELDADPFALPDMEKAVERLNCALDSGEQIAVFGDYDTDGVCAAALLTRYLEARGGMVTPRLPDRQREGYGITAGAVEELHGDGVTLIITVDNGISAYEAADKAKELGVDLLITDHHSPGEQLPEALAIVNPKRVDCTAEFKDYCGAGVAFLLACALEGGDCELLLEEFGDLLALATIGDVVPLLGQNRAIIRHGLAVMNNSPCPGIAALIAASGVSGRPLLAHDVAFRLSPRINAAGRMGSANDALELILCEDEDKAAQLAKKLCEANTKRQAAEREMLQEARRALSENRRYDPVIMLCGEGWHEGIIGIAAAKAAEGYGRPAFILAVNGEKVKGSARSLEGFHIHKALVYCEDLLQYYGGHAMAGGLTMEAAKLESLRERLLEYADGQEMPYPTLKLAAKLSPSSIKPDLLDAVAMLAPFGCGNEEPLFAVTGLTLKSIMPMGEGKHLRLNLAKGGAMLSAALFNTTPQSFPYVPGDRINIALQISENFFRGERRLSIAVKAVRHCAIKQDLLLPALRRHTEFKRACINGAAPSLLELDLPDRELCGKVYTALKQNPNGWQDLAALCAHIGDDGSLACAVALAVDVLREAGLVINNGDGACRLPKPDGKRDLASTPTMKNIEKLK
ncbi:MAG: single-stranded-DNA-specific exonuclease RecJ [Clostridium sp.]|jgi:single-stranded-DNA-specific exonuclease|nr:single-stranded-DNA-specific exonuclease RecJ [Clostridium sp.]